MNTSPVLRTPLLALSFICMSAQAEWRCDCTTILDTCSATVTVEDDWVSIESDHRQCARVDYLIDGVPFVALVVEGRERQSWLSRNDNPRVLMQSCKVCLDNADGRAPVSTPGRLTVEGELSREAELSPLLTVNPEYPSSRSASLSRLSAGSRMRSSRQPSHRTCSSRRPYRRYPGGATTPTTAGRP
jgi:hypothetical protein